MQRQKGLSKAGRESGLRLLHADFGSGDLRRVPADEVVLRLLRSKYRDRWQDPVGITGQEEDVFRVAALQFKKIPLPWLGF